jgi:hypothetical protein
MQFISTRRSLLYTPPVAAGGGGGLDGSESDGTNLIPTGGSGMTAGWSVLATALTTAVTTAPDGTTTAAFSKEDSSSGRHIMYRSDVPSLSNATAYTFSVYAKMNGRRYLQLYCDVGGTTKAYAYFDLQSGVVGDVGKTAGAAVSGTPTSQIQVGANSFYKCTVSFVTGATGVCTTAINLSIVSTYGAPLVSDAPSYAGDNVSGNYLWRPKFTTP